MALAISELVDRPIDSLSGGELQRVALAAALVLRPRLVLLDEPTSQLDPVAGDELIGLLRRLNEEWGMGVLLAEHRLERCLSAADRVVCLDDGAIAFDGSPGGFCAWALATDPELAPPGARLFSLAGLEPPPVSVKQARVALRARGIEATAAPSARSGAAWAPAPRRGKRARGPRSLGRARSGRRRPRRAPRARARGRAGRAGGADGAKRRRQEHPAAGRRGAGRAGAGVGRPRRAAARCSRRAPPTCSCASGSGRSCPGEPGRRGARGGRARLGGRCRPPRPLRRRARAAGAGDRDGGPRRRARCRG